MGSRKILQALCALMLVVACAAAPAVTAAPALPSRAVVDPSSAALHDKVEKLRQDRQYDQALAIAEKALQAADHAQPPDDSETLWWLQELGLIFQELGRYSQAEPHLERSLPLAERLYGGDSLQMVVALRNLALNERGQGRFLEAEAHLKRAIAVSERHANDPSLAWSLNNLGELYAAQGRYREAEAIHRHALAVAEALVGANNIGIASILNNLGYVMTNQARFAEAEALFKRAIEIQERNNGPDHPATARAIGELAALYQVEGRLDEAQALLLRSCDTLQKQLGESHLLVAACTATAASYLHQMHRYALAEQYYRRALDVYQRMLGDSAATAGVLTNFGQLLIDTDRQGEAEPLLQRAVATLEKTLGAEHPDTSRALHALAAAETALGKLADAEADLLKAVGAARKSLPAMHPELEQALSGLSVVQLARGKAEQAFAAAKEAAAIEVALQALSVTAELAGTSRSLLRYDTAFVQELRAAYALAAAQPGREQVLRDAGFGAAQYLAFDETGRAVGQMAARFAARNDPLGRLLHEQQDLLRQSRALNQLIAEAIGSAEPKMRAQAAELRRQSDTLAARLRAIDGQLRRENPTYADLADPRPISLAETQSLLGNDEAAVLVLSAPDETYVFAISRTQVGWTRVNLSREALEQQVLKLRLQVDTSMWQGPIAPFDRALAFSLYQQLLAPLEAVIKDKSKLFIIPTGPLTSLPFSVLVTEPPAGGAKLDSDPFALRQTAWLIKRQALTTLPSISSLRALRVYADKKRGSEAFAGFGDPVFDNAAEEKRRLQNVSRFFRGSETNLQMLRTLPRLNATGDEVRTMARLLGAPESDVYLRERATEAQIKTRDLSRKRIIEIATHGLIAGDLSYAEPGLAFSPPGSATDLDDGYLASSEAARLNLHADLVILSACDTAAGEVPGANGLSGLARSFILAGTKSLLVSHWAVEDRAAMLLTTRTVEGIQGNPARGRAEALRQAMLSVMNEPTTPLFAHPVAWAPFVLVGEPRAN